MEKIKSFTLPKLPYDYKALAPYISEQQLTLHHDKHHQAYVNGANAAFEKLDKARSENADVDQKAGILTALLFVEPHQKVAELKIKDAWHDECRCMHWHPGRVVDRR